MCKVRGKRQPINVTLTGLDTVLAQAPTRRIGTHATACRYEVMSKKPQGDIMSRVPQPIEYGAESNIRWKPPVLPADYSDDVTDEQLDALRKIATQEIGEDEFELVDGPAW